MIHTQKLASERLIIEMKVNKTCDYAADKERFCISALLHYFRRVQKKSHR